ncbi:hypothetical protein ACM25N_07350 [Roseovarius sp. C7]|uniref:hypothetical protein n=1 Tax=Roseovarius sp. C7 TaxID=3398643 RepID=UPI0039F697E4
MADMSWVFQEERQDYPLDTEDAGKALHGLGCPEKEIIKWFEENSWTYQRSVASDGRWYGSGARKYRMDRGLVFCQPQGVFLGGLKGGCRGQTSVIMFDGRITQIISGPTK